MITYDQLPKTEEEARDHSIINETVKRIRKHLMRTCPSINLEQLAHARDVRPWCAHAFPEYGLYMFTLDCTLRVGALSSALLDGNVSIVKAPDIHNAYRLAQEGLQKTQKLAQDYLNGARLTGNEGLSTQVH